MTPAEFAKMHAIANRIHDKRHAGWCCEDMHESVHRDHMAAFRRQARWIVESERVVEDSGLRY